MKLGLGPREPEVCIQQHDTPLTQLLAVCLLLLMLSLLDLGRIDGMVKLCYVASVPLNDQAQISQAEQLVSCEHTSLASSFIFTGCDWPHTAILWKE